MNLKEVENKINKIKNQKIKKYILYKLIIFLIIKIKKT